MIISNRTNSSSIISLAFGILSILIPFIGFILGILGLFFSLKSKKEITLTNEGGLGLATSGLVCSVVGIILQLFIILSFVLYFTVAPSTI